MKGRLMSLESLLSARFSLHPELAGDCLYFRATCPVARVSTGRLSEAATL
jgi:hypothetical protein